MERVSYGGRSLAGWSTVGLCLLILLAGCDEGGNLTETVDTVEERDISGVAGPGDPDQLEPVARVPRDQFGTANTAEALAFPDLNAEERAIFDQALRFFITDRTAEDGLGPIFNQAICLGCHRNSDDIAMLNNGQLSGADLAETSTPASRASRFGPTDHAELNAEILTAIEADDPSIGQDETRGKPPTAAFALFGAFSPAAGTFNPETVFGGPIQHVRTTEGCFPDVIPPESIDPFILGGIDPVTGQPVIGGRRAVGERAAPPYIGRGLMEAIFAGDIVANDDPADGDDSSNISSLESSAVTNPECPGDCISGRHNEGSAAAAFMGGDPVVRVARFGLRAAGPTLIQFMLGGTQGEVGLTSPFIPTEQNNNQNVGRDCDVAPDPELEADDISNLRRLIRLISLPELDACLLGTSDICDAQGVIQASIERGAELFGVDLEAFRSRMVPGMTPVGDPQGINQADRGLNCVGCHTPIMATGQSPAELGAQHLSNKWIPLFSDLLLHDMGEIPAGLSDPVPPPPTSVDGNVTFEMSRNLADFALPGQGLATGREWRTPPLMGLGKIGPPFLHDARVYLSNDSERRARTVQTFGFGTPAQAINVPLVVDDIDGAILAAIELHDLPWEDVAPADGGNCPVPPRGSALAVCPPLTSANRSEARSVMQRWRMLSEDDQQAVIDFLKAL